MSELVQPKLNIESSVGDSTTFAATCSSVVRRLRRKPPQEAFVTEAENVDPLPLIEVVILRRLKAYNYRLYPNDEQAVLIHKTFGCVRFVYNQMQQNHSLTQIKRCTN